MKMYRKYSVRWMITAMIVSVLLNGSRLLAGDDPSIKGALREGIQASMKYFIETQSVGEKLHLYDPVEGKLLRLKFKELHKGIVQKGDYYISCADFIDQNGRKLDLDFLVVKDGSALRTLQAIIHSINKEKRKYHIESE